jgi:DNA polymerase (family X)
MLARVRPARSREADEPPLDLLPDVDREYREKAGRDALPRIASRRLDPSGETRLPVLHTGRGDRQLTALRSNTARAHELGRTRDRVVVYFPHDGGPEGQRTIVTETRGRLRGRRVVRGREAECLAAADEAVGGGSAE